MARDIPSVAKVFRSRNGRKLYSCFKVQPKITPELCSTIWKVFSSFINVVQLKFSLHLTPMHMSLFSDRLIIFQAYQFKEIRHFETNELKNHDSLM